MKNIWTPERSWGDFRYPGRSREILETTKGSWEVPERRGTQNVLETAKDPKRSPKTTVLSTKGVARNGLSRGF